MNSLVLSGGGVKGYAYIGVIKYLYQKKIIKNIKNFSGTSIGAIFCLLLIMKFTDNEISNLFLNFDLLKLKDFSYSNIVDENLWGFNNIQNLLKIVKLCMKYKNVDCDITFSELNKTFDNINFFVIATKLPNFKEVCFSNKTTPNIRVLDAIRASINIPIVFNKCTIGNEYYIDGGFTNNFPIEYLDKENTLAFCLVDKEITTNTSSKIQIKSLIEYTLCLLKGIHLQYGIFQRQKLEFYKNKKNIQIYKIMIDSEKFSSINFDISKENKLELIKLGYITFKQNLHSNQDSNQDS